MSCTQVPGVYCNGYGISPFFWVIYIYVYTIRIEGVAALFEVPSSLVVVLVVSCQSNWGFASNFLDAGSLTGGWPTVNLYFPFNETETDRNHWRLKTGQICLIGWASVCCDPRWAPVSWPWHVRSMICGKENLRRRIREVLAGLGRWIHPSPWIEVHKKHETTADYFHKMGMHIIYIHTTYSYVQQYTFTCTWYSSGWSFRTLLAVHSYLQGHDSPIDQHSLRAGRSQQHRHPLDIKHLWMLKCSYPK